MSILSIRTAPHGSPDYDRIIALRQKVLRDPLGLTLNPQDLAKEINDFHLMGEKDGQLIACAVVTPIDDKRVQIRQMAVEPEWQGKGLGREMLVFAENLAHEKGYKKVSLHAREIVSGFYEKMGYKKTGLRFNEITLPHCIMEKIL